MNDWDKEVFFFRGFGQGSGQSLETRGFIKSFGFSMKQDPAKTLAGQKSCDLIRWGLLWSGYAEKKPRFLIGVAGKQFRQDGVGDPWPDRCGTNRAIQMGKTGEAQ